MKNKTCKATGGYAKSADIKQDKAMIAKAIKAAEKKEPKGLAAGGTAKLRKGFPNTIKKG